MLRILTTWTAPQGAPYYTNMYFAGLNQAQAEDAHSAVAGLWNNFQADISTAYGCTVQGDVDVVTPATGQVTDQHTVAPVTFAGDDAGQPLPFTTQGLIRWSTGFWQSGRQVRGRTFIPGITEGQTQGGVPDPAFIAVWNPFLVTFLGATDPGNEFGIWSRTAGNHTAVSAGAMWDQWAVLRSRRD